LKWKLGRIKDTNAATISAGNLMKINRAIEIAPDSEHAALKGLQAINAFLARIEYLRRSTC
jgi:hypothetical protein